ncbi:hypothetical protein [Ruegeria atlantica]|uniref:hypothetical protein n=1 Tax=Ruegeria atlantica TaxID=81569 RepID=UPI001479C2BE|nr:hypothetical protein [Ruegeria atlantica]
MLSETLNAMRRRMAWRDARKILQVCGCETGQGWAKTIAKILANPDHVDVGRLQDCLVEHNLCGEKFTKLYPISRDARQRLEGRISAFQVGTSETITAYPNTLDDAELAKENTALQVVAIESNEDGIGLVLSSIIALKTREEISFEEFDAPKELQDRYDEVIGMTFRKVQLFSVIWVPHHRNYLEIRTDCPKGINEYLSHGFHSTLKSFVVEVLGEPLGKPVNLWPAVRRFYDDDEDGIVTEITFSTSTSGIKNEKMVKRGNERLDQRKELYHTAGKDALPSDISVYRIAVEWNFGDDQVTYSPNIALSASGPSSMANGNSPTISGVLVGNCLRATDYEYAIDKLGKKADMQ